MEEARKWRFRFGLRALLLAVAVSAMSAWLYKVWPNSVSKWELASIQNGMTRDEVLAILGEPTRITRMDDLSQLAGKDYELWWYATPILHMGSDWPEVGFENGKVVSVAK